MFTLELRTYVLPQDGLVFTADGGSDGLVGGCLALPPDRWQMPSTVNGRTAARWLWALGRQLPRVSRAQRALEEHHPTEPHYYIRWIGVRPGLRGQGLGSALMRPTLDRCDSTDLPAYLEASSERSAALYERLGFMHLGVCDDRTAPGVPTRSASTAVRVGRRKNVTAVEWRAVAGSPVRAGLIPVAGPNAVCDYSSCER